MLLGLPKNPKPRQAMSGTNTFVYVAVREVAGGDGCSRGLLMAVAVGDLIRVENN